MVRAVQLVAAASKAAMKAAVLAAMLVAMSAADMLEAPGVATWDLAGLARLASLVVAAHTSSSRWMRRFRRAERRRGGSCRVGLWSGWR